MENNDKYYKKYLKYKNKYLQLKNKFVQLGGLNPNPNSNQMNSFFSNSINMLTNPNNPMLFALSDEQKQLLNQIQKFSTSDNTKLFSDIMTSLLSHVTNAKFLPLIMSIIKNISVLVGGGLATGKNPLMILFELNNLLGQLKNDFPKEFDLLKQFFISNRNQIVPIVNNLAPGIFNDNKYLFIIDFLLK